MFVGYIVNDVVGWIGKIGCIDNRWWIFWMCNNMCFWVLFVEFLDVFGGILFMDDVGFFLLNDVFVGNVLCNILCEVLIWCYDDCVVVYCVNNLCCVWWGVVDVWCGFNFGCGVYIIYDWCVWIVVVYFFNVFGGDIFG